MTGSESSATIAPNNTGGGPVAESLDLLWGADEMAPVIKRTPRQVYAMLDQRIIPARKVGSRWCITRDELIAFFTKPMPAREMETAS